MADRIVQLRGFTHEELLAIGPRRNTPRGQIDQQRYLAFGPEGKDGLYFHYTKALDARLKAFFAANPDESTFPAVDLASGSALIPVMFGLRYRQPLYPASLQWYVSEWDDLGPVERQSRMDSQHLNLYDSYKCFLECLTRPAIQIMADEAVADSPLFTDVNNTVVYPKDRVVLLGLSTKEFNGLRGIMLGRDTKAQGRFLVQLDKRDKPLSFKGENVRTREVQKELSIELKSQRDLVSKGENGVFFDGLLERACEIDVQKHETWANVSSQYGKCALVTCTIFLNCMGYRGPLAWQDVLELASKLLAVGGFLLTYDPEKWGGYANVPIMEAYVATKSLGLQLEQRNVPTAWDTNDGRMFLLVWKRVNSPVLSFSQPEPKKKGGNNKKAKRKGGR